MFENSNLLLFVIEKQRKLWPGHDLNLTIFLLAYFKIADLNL